MRYCCYLRAVSALRDVELVDCTVQVLRILLLLATERLIRQLCSIVDVRCEQQIAGCLIRLCTYRIIDPIFYRVTCKRCFQADSSAAPDGFSKRT